MEEMEEKPKPVFTYYVPPKDPEPVRAVPRPQPPALRAFPGSVKMPDGSIELRPKK